MSELAGLWASGWNIASSTWRQLWVVRMLPTLEKIARKGMFSLQPSYRDSFTIQGP